MEGMLARSERRMYREIIARGDPAFAEEYRSWVLEQEADLNEFEWDIYKEWCEKGWMDREAIEFRRRCTACLMD